MAQPTVTVSSSSSIGYYTKDVRLSKQLMNVREFVAQHAEVYKHFRYMSETSDVVNQTKFQSWSNLEVRDSEKLPGYLGVYTRGDTLINNKKADIRKPIVPYGGIVMWEELYNKFESLYHCPTAFEVNSLNYTLDPSKCEDLVVKAALIATIKALTSVNPSQPATLQHGHSFTVKVLIIGNPTSFGPIFNSPFQLNSKANCKFDTCTAQELKEYLIPALNSQYVVRSDIVWLSMHAASIPPNTELLVDYGETKNTSFFQIHEDDRHRYCLSCFGKKADSGNALYICSQHNCHLGQHQNCFLPSDSTYAGLNWYCPAHAIGRMPSTLTVILDASVSTPPQRHQAIDESDVNMSPPPISLTTSSIQFEVPDANNCTPCRATFLHESEEECEMQGDSESESEEDESNDDDDDDDDDSGDEDAIIDEPRQSVLPGRRARRACRALSYCDDKSKMLLPSTLFPYATVPQGSARLSPVSTSQVYPQYPDSIFLLENCLRENCKLLGVEVKDSSINNAGRGCFAKKTFKKDDVIGWLFGKIVPEDVWNSIAGSNNTDITWKEGEEDFCKPAAAGSFRVVPFNDGQFVIGSQSCPMSFLNSNYNSCKSLVSNAYSNLVVLDHSTLAEDAFKAVEIRANCSISVGDELLLDYKFAANIRRAIQMRVRNSSNNQPANSSSSPAGVNLQRSESTCSSIRTQPVSLQSNKKSLAEQSEQIAWSKVLHDSLVESLAAFKETLKKKKKNSKAAQAFLYHHKLTEAASKQIVNRYNKAKNCSKCNPQKTINCSQTGLATAYGVKSLYTEGLHFLHSMDFSNDQVRISLLASINSNPCDSDSSDSERRRHKWCNALLCDDCYCDLAIKKSRTTIYYWLNSPAYMESRNALSYSKIKKIPKRVVMMKAIRDYVSTHSQDPPNGSECQPLTLPCGTPVQVEIKVIQENTTDLFNDRVFNYFREQKGKTMIDRFPQFKASTFKLALKGLAKAADRVPGERPPRKALKIQFASNNPIAKCDQCSKYNNELIHLTNIGSRFIYGTFTYTTAYQQVSDLLRDHNVQQQEQRTLFDGQKTGALLDPSMLETITFDGMDTSKTPIPHFLTKPHCADLAPIDHRIVGAIAYGGAVPNIGISNFAHIGKGASASIAHLDCILDLQWEAMDPTKLGPAHNLPDEFVTPALPDDPSSTLLPSNPLPGPASNSNFDEWNAAYTPESYGLPLAAAKPKVSFVWPKALHLVFDNASSDAKNSGFFRYLGMLVSINVFMYIFVQNMMVGHTHDIVDAMFGIYAQALLKHDAKSLSEMRALFREKYSSMIYSLDEDLRREGREGGHGGSGLHSNHISDRLVALGKVLGVEVKFVELNFAINHVGWAMPNNYSIPAISVPHNFLIQKDPITNVVWLYCRWFADSKHEEHVIKPFTDANSPGLPHCPWTSRVALWDPAVDQIMPCDLGDPMRVPPSVVITTGYTKMIDAHEKTAGYIGNEDALKEMRALITKMDKLQLAMSSSNSCETCSGILHRIQEIGTIATIKDTDSKALQDQLRAMSNLKTKLTEQLRNHVSDPDFHSQHQYLKAVGFWTKWKTRAKDVIIPYFQKRKFLSPPSAAASIPTENDLRAPSGRMQHPIGGGTTVAFPGIKAGQVLTRDGGRVDAQWAATHDPPAVGDFIITRGSEKPGEPFWVGRIKEVVSNDNSNSSKKPREAVRRSNGQIAGMLSSRQVPHTAAMASSAAAVTVPTSFNSPSPLATSSNLGLPPLHPNSSASPSRRSSPRVSSSSPSSNSTPSTSQPGPFPSAVLHSNTALNSNPPVASLNFSQTQSGRTAAATKRGRCDHIQQHQKYIVQWYHYTQVSNSKLKLNDDANWATLLDVEEQKFNRSPQTSTQISPKQSWNNCVEGFKLNPPVFHRSQQWILDRWRGVKFAVLQDFEERTIRYDQLVLWTDQMFTAGKLRHNIWDKIVQDLCECKEQRAGFAPLPISSSSAAAAAASSSSSASNSPSSSAPVIPMDLCDG